MLSAAAAWFAKEGVALLLGALAKLAVDAFSAAQASRAQRDLGRVTAERDSSEATRQAVERELQASRDAPQTVDDAAKRFEEGSA